MAQIRDGLLVPPVEPPKVDINKLLKTFENGAKWFYWIAGLSLVNSGIHFARGNVSFVIGLGITQIIDAIAMFASEGHPEVSIIFRIIALGFAFIFAGIFALFGRFACKRHSWAFIIGMILYVLDGLLFLLVRDWLSIGFHAFAFICILVGYNALRKLNHAQSLIVRQPEPMQPPPQ
jgi:hypothetical protein